MVSVLSVRKYILKSAICQGRLDKLASMCYISITERRKAHEVNIFFQVTDPILENKNQKDKEYGKRVFRGQLSHLRF